MKAEICHCSDFQGKEYGRIFKTSCALLQSTNLPHEWDFVDCQSNSTVQGRQKVSILLLHSLKVLSPNRYVMDLSNEVLNIDFGQGAEKISEVKVGGQ